VKKMRKAMFNSLCIFLVTVRARLSLELK
jgi:hypothetical protein